MPILPGMWGPPTQNYEQLYGACASFSHKLDLQAQTS